MATGRVHVLMVIGATGATGAEGAGTYGEIAQGRSIGASLNLEVIRVEIDVHLDHNLEGVPDPDPDPDRGSDPAANPDPYLGTGPTLGLKAVLAGDLEAEVD